MSQKSSDILVEQDEKLKKLREENGIKTTPYNYDTTIDMPQVEALVATVSTEKITENADAIISAATQTVDKPKTQNPNIEATSLDTRAISEHKNTPQNLGVNNDKEKNER